MTANLTVEQEARILAQMLMVRLESEVASDGQWTVRCLCPVGLRVPSGLVGLDNKMFKSATHLSWESALAALRSARAE